MERIWERRERICTQVLLLLMWITPNGGSPDSVRRVLHVEQGPSRSGAPFSFPDVSRGSLSAGKGVNDP